MRQLIFLIAFLWIAVTVRAQKPETGQAVEDLLEATGENMSDESDIQEILDDWDELQRNPLNVNFASKEEFQRLHLLSEVQIERLIAYRAKNGTIYTIYELAAVDGLDQEILQKIEPFVSFEANGNSATRKRPTTNVLSRATRSFDHSSSADQSKYEGSPERLYLRLKHIAPQLEYGFVVEKDPGEAFLRKSNKHGFDYNSAFANFRLGDNSRLFAGDYVVRFGQGLVAWQGFSMGKSAETTQVFRSAPGIRSYTSTDENQFFRGLAARLNYRNLTFSPFVSYHKLDASIDTIDGVGYFGALQTIGYHRTSTEIENEKSLALFATGAHVAFETGNWTFGGTAVFNHFNAIMDRSDESYNQFLPEGQNHLAGSFDWKGSFRKVFVFGEGAVSENGGKALISGLMTNPAQNAEVSVVYRNINKTYFSYFANTFTESSRANDEHALYLGFKIFPVSRFTLQAYADFFRFNWLKYTTAAPGGGTEFFAQLTYTPSRKTDFYLRFFREEKDQRLIDGNKRYNVPQLINRLRLNYSHNLSEAVSIKSRFEFSYFSKQTSERGFLVFQDIFYRPTNGSFSLNGRVAYFSTDGYNSRLYAYENDLLFSFSVPALYSKGIRTYLNLQKDFGRRISCWLKLGTTQSVGKQNPEDSGISSRSEIKFQVRYHF